MLQWQGCEVAILASGPSMSATVASQVLTWKNAAAQRRVIVINTTFRLAPWADALYACDLAWWKEYIAEVRRTFLGELWTQDPSAKQAYAINHVQSKRGKGLNAERNVVNQGENSGYQCIGLMYQAGVKKILLCGWDMRGTHWHADHPGKMGRANDYSSWLRYYPQLALDLGRVGVEVINCTPNSALKLFRNVDIATLV